MKNTTSSLRRVRLPRTPADWLEAVMNFLFFLCGMLAQNFDISVIFVDAFLKLVKTDIENTENFFQRLAELSEKHNVKFVLSVNVDDAVAPEFIKKYFI